MKKSRIFKSGCTILVVLLISGAVMVSAQSINRITESAYRHEVLPERKAEQVRNLQMHTTSKSTQGRWYNYATTMQKAIFPDGQGANMIAPRIFPDASVIVKYGDGGRFPVYVHSAAVVLDPTADVFYDESQALNMTRLNKYRIDSIGMLCVYRRHIPDPEIVDTLIVEMIANIKKGSSYYYTDMKNRFGYDTVRFCGLKRKNVTFSYIRPDASVQLYTQKIPLTEFTASDTLTGGFNFIYIKSPQTNYYGNLCAFTFRFKPGYTWNQNDTINLSLNEFMFFSYEENGKGTFPYYSPDNDNSSQTVTNQALDPNDSYYKAQLYQPSVGFPQNYQLENHWIDFKLVSNNVGISENKQFGVSLEQNYPNPATNNTVISYQLSNHRNVALSITDLSGKTVLQIDEGMKSAGKHIVKLNTANLSKGMYFYTLTADDIKLTRKLIINN